MKRPIDVAVPQNAVSCVTDDDRPLLTLCPDHPFTPRDGCNAGVHVHGSIGSGKTSPQPRGGEARR